MAAVAKRERAEVKQYNFAWTGKDRSGKVVKGEMRAGGQNVVVSALRRQGIQVSSVKKARTRGGKKITEKDITVFTRQLAVMMKAGVPLLQAFDIVGRGHANPSVGKLLLDIKTDVETGSSLAQAFRRYPLHFDALFCNLVAAGEQAGILDALLDRLATYKEKILAIKGKIKSALFYPIAVIVVALIVTAVIMIFVIPVFKDLFKSFGADLPGPTLVVMAISDWFIANWWWLFPGLIGGIWFFMYSWKRSLAIQRVMDRLALRLPVFGEVIRKAAIARWCRTLSTMFAAGVPLVDALESVSGAAGNYVYFAATKQIQSEVSTGTALTAAMTNSGVFPNMVLQMTAIGEESGALDAMLSKVADFFEQEVDEAVDSLSSLMEPMIMVILGGLIGGIVVAMYLPIFKMGQAI
ncbi:MAG: type II secretion system F family protein [Betaproteobacteria bacterium]